MSSFISEPDSDEEKDIARTEEVVSPVVAAFLLWFGRDVTGEHLLMQLNPEDFGKKMEVFPERAERMTK